MSYKGNDDDSKKEKHLENLSFDELEKDDLEIKSYLNSSLDLSGINVSEDLIGKTIAAIMQADEEKQESKFTSGSRQEDIHKKEAGKNNKRQVVPINKMTWSKYIRRFAGVAAALLVLAAGINFTKIGVKLDKGTAKDNNVSYDMQAASTEAADSKSSSDTNTSPEKKDAAAGAAAAQEAPAVTEVTLAPELNANLLGTSEGGSSKQAGVSTDQKDMKVTAENDNSMDASANGDQKTAAAVTEKPKKAVLPRKRFAGVENVAGIPDDTIVSGAADNSNKAFLEDNKLAQSVTPALGSGQKNYVDFTDFFLTDKSQAEYVIITDMVNDTEIKLTAQQDIAEFYSVMEQQQYISTEYSLTTHNYSIKVKSLQQEGIAYSMMIGNSIIVNDNTGYTVKQSNYAANNISLLITELNEFYQKFSK